MSEWTEYHPGLDWPEGDNVKWQNLRGGEWHDIKESDPKQWWEFGHRVRYCIPKVKTMGDLKFEAWDIVAEKQYFSSRQAFIEGFNAGWKAAKEHPEVE
jgi:hypothetical protein